MITLGSLPATTLIGSNIVFTVPFETFLLRNINYSCFRDLNKHIFAPLHEHATLYKNETSFDLLFSVIIFFLILMI